MDFDQRAQATLSSLRAGALPAGGFGHRAAHLFEFYWGEKLFDRVMPKDFQSFDS